TVLFLSAALLLPRSITAGPMRIIIDTDAACERDDQHAIAYALLSPEIFEIEGFTAAHNGPGTMERNFLEIHNIMGLAGLGKIPVLRGAAGPLPGPGRPQDSPAARFIIERARADAGGKPLVVLGIGCATNLASAILLDPSIKDRVSFAWLGGVDWPDSKGGEYNSVGDIEAQRVLFYSGVKLKNIPCGNNLLLTTRQISAKRLRGVSPLADYLHYLVASTRYPADEPFNIADLFGIAALAHPELFHWITSPAPSINSNGGYDWSRTYGNIQVATGMVEDLSGAPRPVWEKFYGKVSGAAPPEPACVREELCALLNIPPADPDVAPVVGKTETFEGFTRQDVRWPTIGHDSVLAYVCKPLEAGSKKLPAVICLSGTGGDRVVLTSAHFGKAEYVSLGRNNPHKRLHGWASELTRRGYATLSMTQRSLGDRRRFGAYDSKSLMLQGAHFQGHQAYEIRQALTYLQHEPDVDPARVACTGMSFGGITTFYATAVDTRFKAAAPLCGGVGALRQTLLVGDTGYHGHYWWVPGILLYFDQGDIVAAQAPRPYFIAAPLDDIGMPKEGVDELEAKAAPAYKRAGAPDALRIFRPQGLHSFTSEIFEELVKFFNDYL
ncbi:MAG: nucleoside hydrolase, partial [Gemmatimonadota bacterium]|nr:nucleoside hydrolase [Gemmatimonadota bacterium]